MTPGDFRPDARPCRRCRRPSWDRRHRQDHRPEDERHEYDPE